MNVTQWHNVSFYCCQPTDTPMHRNEMAQIFVFEVFRARDCSSNTYSIIAFLTVLLRVLTTWPHFTTCSLSLCCNCTHTTCHLQKFPLECHMLKPVCRPIIFTLVSYCYYHHWKHMHVTYGLRFPKATNPETEWYGSALKSIFTHYFV